MKMFVVLVAATNTLVACGIHNQHSTEGNTKVYRQGNSTATISQDGASSEITVERDTDSQTIVQRSAGNSAVIKQSSAPPETKKASENRVRSGIGSQTSEKFRRLFLDRLDKSHFD